MEESLTRRCKTAESEVDRLKEELQHEAKRSQQLKANYAQLQEGYDASLNALRRDLDQVTAKLSECKLERDHATGQLEEVGRALEVTEEEKERLRGDREQAVEEMEELERKYAEMTKEGDRKQRDLEDEMVQLRRAQEQEVDLLK